MSLEHSGCFFIVNNYATFNPTPGAGKFRLNVDISQIKRRLLVQVALHIENRSLDAPDLYLHPIHNVVLRALL
jgi:hypothetical protein